MNAAPLPTEEIDRADALLGRARRFIRGMVEIDRLSMEGPRRLTARSCRVLLAEFVAAAEAAPPPLQRLPAARNPSGAARRRLRRS